MDCDTTGIEPDFALVKFKKLAGGGYFKIVNQSVPERAQQPRLQREPRCRRSSRTSRGTNTLLGAPHVNRAHAQGSAASPTRSSRRPRRRSPASFELDLAFGAVGPRRGGLRAPRRHRRSSAARSPASRCSSTSASRRPRSTRRSDVDHRSHDDRGRAAPASRALRRSSTARTAAARTGKRFLAPMSHVKMMAAAQPFLSGAISKTVNLPNDATVEDVADDLRGGLAARPQGGRALPRRLQGLAAALASASKTTRRTTSAEAEAKRRDAAPTRRCRRPRSTRRSSRARASTPRRAPARARASRLPKKRRGFTQEARVGGHKIFLRTGEYEDGTLGEIFIDMHKEGAAFRSLMNCFAMSVSIGLQYGVPLETYVEQFTFTRFEPQGVGRGAPERQVRDVDRRLHLPRARRRVPAPLRPRAREARGRGAVARSASSATATRRTARALRASARRSR